MAFFITRMAVRGATRKAAYGAGRVARRARPRVRRYGQKARARGSFYRGKYGGRVRAYGGRVRRDARLAFSRGGGRARWGARGRTALRGTIAYDVGRYGASRMRRNRRRRY